ncbi:hypothetical protein B7494_g901 [Chlorociboria aeruginascens]|nr:hypothetical protein B7494_g901 [Chlorociboria aeruginascens]
MAGQPVNMGLKLFPPPPSINKSRSRSPSSRRNETMSPTPTPPESSMQRSNPPQLLPDGRQSALDGRQSALDGRQTPEQGRYTPTPHITPPRAVLGGETPRSHTSLSEAPTLIRSNSNSSHTSLVGRLNQSTAPREEPIMRSIFPRYNPELPLEYQQYYPTQASPTHIPRAVINRPQYSPSINERSASGLQSPMSIGRAPGTFPRGVQDEAILEPSSNEELRALWKVTNGWRVSASEGCTFCLKMTSAAEEPIHTLSSATHPFYTLRINPTSTSAIVTMTRQDPAKASKDSSLPKLTSSKPNPGLEVITTTLEETARRLPPNDGLVAVLFPRAASNMVIELANKGNRQDDNAVYAAAEHECGRLVWDHDSQKYYLVHPAMNTPFVISISSSPAWSRVEYALEHPELPHNLVRLVRDGSGTGFLEVDTTAAARIDCFYIVDVAICAMLLVATTEEKGHNVERFNAPPAFLPIFPNSPKTPKSAKSIRSIKPKKAVKMEEFEIDVESQDSLKGKKYKKEKNDEVPGCCGLIWMLLKFGVWVVAMAFKAIGAVIKCVTARKS